MSTKIGVIEGRDVKLLLLRIERIDGAHCMKVLVEELNKLGLALGLSFLIELQLCMLVSL